MAFKSKEVVNVFDIEGKQIKLAQVVVDDGKPSISKLVAVNAKDSGQAAVAGALRRLSTDFKMAGTPVIVNIQRYNVTVKNIKLPSTNPSEIDKMVTLQAAKQLPFSPDKIISSYRILDRDDNGYSNIMMTLVHRDIVGKMLALFSAAGLEVEKLALGSEALSLWCLEKIVRARPKTRTCLIDVGHQFLELQVLGEGKIIFSRAINFSSPRDARAKIVDEVKRSLLTFKKISSGAAIDKLIITGRRSVIDEQAPILKRELGLSMAFVDAVKQSPRRRDAVIPKAELLSALSFSAVIATALYYNSMQVNFVPLEIRSSRISKMIKESLLITTTLCLCILIGIGGILLKNYLVKKARLAEITAKLKESEPKVKRLARLKMSADIIKRQLDLKGSSIDILRELYSKIPPQITLTIFDYEDKRSCLLRGTANQLSDVFTFNSTLEDSEYFENVKVRYATKRAVGSQEMTDFEIICQLTPMEGG
jgi:Tfp pilus assembly PilM family ATPase